jgi:hypothetical protein
MINTAHGSATLQNTLWGIHSSDETNAQTDSTSLLTAVYAPSLVAAQEVAKRLGFRHPDVRPVTPQEASLAQWQPLPSDLNQAQRRISVRQALRYSRITDASTSFPGIQDILITLEVLGEFREELKAHYVRCEARIPNHEGYDAIESHMHRQLGWNLDAVRQLIPELHRWKRRIQRRLADQKQRGGRV